MVEGIPHELMDFLPPTHTCTVVEWRALAMQAIRSITLRGHLPIVVGGTGMYIQALIDNYQIPAVSPQPTFRAAMAGKSLDELVKILLRLDPDAARVVDLKNDRRVLRALEVTTFTGKPFTAQRCRGEPELAPLIIAPLRSREELHERIDHAVEKMVERGWIDEIRRLREQGIPWDAPAMSSIGYRELGVYIRGEGTLEQAIVLAKRATKQYAKRQMTWFKRDKRIRWVETIEEAVRVVKQWMGE